MGIDIYFQNVNLTYRIIYVFIQYAQLEERYFIADNYKSISN